MKKISTPYNFVLKIVLAIAASLILFFSMSILTSCSSEEDETTSADDYIIEESSDEEDSESNNKDSNAKSERELLKIAKEQYDADETYQDEMISFRYLLLGKSQMVSLTITDGFSSNIAISYDEFARTEQTTVGDQVYLNFYDKTNKAITFICDSDDAEDIVKYVNSKTSN